MEPFAPLLIMGAAAALGFLFHSLRRSARLRAWRRAARVAGLSEIEETDGLFESSLRCRSGDLRVRFESFRRGKHERGTRIVIEGLNHGTGGLSLRAEGFGSTLEKMVGEREIELGDPGLDTLLYVKGDPALARAVLDAETRRSLVRLFRGQFGRQGLERQRPRVKLADGVLAAEVREGLFLGRAAQVGDVLDSLLAVAQRLIAPRDLAARMAENLSREPQPEVRLRTLKLLTGSYPRHPATRESLLAGRHDESDEVRLYAALALGEEGRETLLTLASDEAADDACGLQAVAALGTTLSTEQVEAILRTALRARRLGVARAAVAGFARGAGGAAVPLLATILAQERGELGAAAATALGGLAETAVEGPLVEALRAGDGAVRAAAAQALGRAASVSAVPALRAVVEGDGEREVSRAARQAIAQIQSRLSGAAPGQLSLATGTAGELSLAEGEPGSLSLANGEEPLETLPAASAAATEDEPALPPPAPRARESA